MMDPIEHGLARARSLAVGRHEPKATGTCGHAGSISSRTCRTVTRKDQQEDPTLSWFREQIIVKSKDALKRLDAGYILRFEMEHVAIKRQCDNKNEERTLIAGEHREAGTSLAMVGTLRSTGWISAGGTVGPGRPEILISRGCDHHPLTDGYLEEVTERLSRLGTPRFLLNFHWSCIRSREFEGVMLTLSLRAISLILQLDLGAPSWYSLYNLLRPLAFAVPCPAAHVDARNAISWSANRTVMRFHLISKDRPGR
nr:hypothetical protein CFP56_16934 [Quercus suber]